MSRRLTNCLGLLLFCAWPLSGCQVSPQTAFPTAQTVASSGAAPGIDIATLTRGRKIFTTSCTECHVARSIAGYTVEQWRLNINEMAPRAHLKPDERTALEAYLLAARASLPPG